MKSELLKFLVAGGCVYDTSLFLIGLFALAVGNDILWSSWPCGSAQLIAGGCVEDALQYVGVFEFNTNNTITETGKALGSA